MKDKSFPYNLKCYYSASGEQNLLTGTVYNDADVLKLLKKYNIFPKWTKHSDVRFDWDSCGIDILNPVTRRVFGRLE
jgi:hypothetical protein